MNIKYLFVVSLALFFVVPKKAQAQTVDSELMSIDAFSDDDNFLINHDEDNIFGDDQQIITTNARTLQNATPIRGIFTDEFLYRWYIQGGAGAQFLMGEDDSKGSFSSRLTLAPSLSVGYRFNPIFGIRANFSGGSLHGFNDGHSGTYRFWNGKSDDQKKAIAEQWVKDGVMSQSHYNKHGISEIERWDPQWNYMGVAISGNTNNKWNPNHPNGDQIWYNDKDNAVGYHWLPGQAGHLYMQHVRYITFNPALTMNLSNLFGGANDARKFDFSIYAGPSLFHVFPHIGQTAYNGVGVFGGLEAQYHINEKFGLFLNMNGYAMPDGFDGHLGGDTFDLIGQSVFGLTYKFPSERMVMPSDPFEAPLQEDPNDELNKIRIQLMEEMNQMVDLQPEIDKLRAQLARLQTPPPTTVVEEPEPEGFFLPEPVHFAIGKTDIDAQGWSVLERVGAYLNSNPTATVIITGYADKDTGTDAINERLSRERSKKVADALVARYGISQGRVAIDWRGDSMQPFMQNARNRAVLFYIEFD